MSDYSPDSDDSNDEDERPNRWVGPPSTWQQLNSAEIDTLTALNDIRNRDLSVHLYNAFALKQGRDAQDPVSREDPIEQFIRDSLGQWRPPKSWTAWPMSAGTVPRPNFLTQTSAPDEAFTFRKEESELPSADLEDAIAASMLRCAKEKFKARPTAQYNDDLPRVVTNTEDGEDPESHIGSGTDIPPVRKARSRSRSRSVKDETASDGGRMDLDMSDIPRRRTRNAFHAPALEPVVAADDELSHQILRPTVRHILSKLDKTLTVLHHTQESITNYQSDSADSDASDGSSRSQSQGRSRSRGRGRPPHPRRTTRVRRPAQPDPEGKRRVGRPMKEYARLEGETDRAYTIRIAKLQKKPMPIFSDSDAEPQSESTPAPESAAEKTTVKEAKGGRGRSRLEQSRRKNESADASESERSAKQMPRRTRIGPRNWRDVLGAAALAGFPAPVLDRAARRCADLFGGSFSLHTLQEGPPDQPYLNRRVQYDPGMAMPSLLGDEEDGEDDDVDGEGRWYRTSRASSAGPSEDERRGRPTRVRQRRMSRSRSRSKSRSRSSAGAAFYCPIDDCPRSADPFSRRTNMLRHLKLIHRYEGDELPDEIDSEDEMYGAVHVDGFLRRIAMRRGWRGEDSYPRAPRARSWGGGSEKDTVMRDDDEDGDSD